MSLLRWLKRFDGSEFSDRAFRKEKSRHGRDYPNILEPFLEPNGSGHKFICPRTPKHNDRLERSHRADREKFYSHLRFHSPKDLREQGRRWNLRYNKMPKQILGFKSPDDAELEGQVTNSMRKTVRSDAPKHSCKDVIHHLETNKCECTA